MKISRERYYCGEYFAATRHFYEEVFEDDSVDGKGRRGECLIYEALREIPGAKKFLFRPMIRVGNAKAEGDVLMLHETGIYVFESKNFGGRVGGSEGKKKWVQFLDGSKHFLENPAWQNERFIRNVFGVLWPEFCEVPYFSFVVFGGACTPGNVCMETSRHTVVTLENLEREVLTRMKQNRAVLDASSIGKLFSRLEPATQKAAADRNRHVNRARRAKWLSRRSKNGNSPAFRFGEQGLYSSR